MAAEGLSDKAAPDVEVCMKQRCVIEFLHVEKMTPTDIHWCQIEALSNTSEILKIILCQKETKIV